MMPEISLNILDIAENSVKAGSSLVTIEVTADTDADRMTVSVEDDGCGMTAEQVAQVTDPFFTTRTTRKVGLGVPFFKQAAECTGGSFSISSEPGRGTRTEAVFVLSSIDRMPLGDMTATVHTLVTMHTDIDFVFRYSVGGRSFELDTRQFRQILGDVPFTEPEVSDYIRGFLRENISEVNNTQVI